MANGTNNDGGRNGTNADETKEVAQYRITDGTKDADGNLTFRIVSNLTDYADNAPDRISNLKKVSEQHDDLKDAKLRSLVRQGKIYVNARIYPGDDDDNEPVVVFRITDASIADYRAKVASGEYGTRNNTATHTSMIAVVPNELVDAFNKYCADNGIVATLRYKTKDDNDNTTNDNNPSDDNVKAENTRRTSAKNTTDAVA